MVSEHKSMISWSHTAESLEAIAEHLEEEAKDKLEGAEHAPTQKSRRFIEGEANGLQFAARLLRRTTIVPPKKKE